MVKLQVLGTGCPKCRKLTELTDQAATMLGLDYELEKVENIKDIMTLGVMMTPALVVDGKVRIQGNVPSLDDLLKILQS